MRGVKGGGLSRFIDLLRGYTSIYGDKLGKNNQGCSFEGRKGLFKDLKQRDA
jgi:hypothetical protein